MTLIDALTFLCWAVSALVILHIIKAIVLFVLLVSGLWASAKDDGRE